MCVCVCVYCYLQGTEVIEGHSLNITKSWQPPPSQCVGAGSIRSSGHHTKQRPGATAVRPGGGDLGQSDDWDDNHHQQRFSNDGVEDDGPNADDRFNVIEGAARSKVSRSSSSSSSGWSHTMGGRSHFVVVVVRLVWWSAGVSLWALQKRL